MVLVEDVTDSANSRTQESTAPSQSQKATLSTMANYILQDRVTGLLFLTRLFTLICTILFMVPFSGFDAATLYHKALLSSAATSALKLHQRMAGVPFQLNRIYLATLMIEDSFHYLLFALIFMNNSPITIVLMPVTGFALLHVANYMKTLINLNGDQTSYGLLRKWINVLCSKDKDIMRFVALNEIIVFPTIIVMIIAGKSTFFMPFVYYRFLSMRYSSRRNPYNKMIFYESRKALEDYTSNPSCPQMVKNITQRLIGLISKMAPVQ